MNNTTLLSSLLFSALSFGAPHSYYIIIHGTWTRPFSWHMPGGDFFDALSSVANLGTVSFFLWSGKNKHEARLEASKDLVEHIRLFYPEDATIHIVGHSHGSNVGILASQLLGQSQETRHRIRNFYALGTPTNHISYMPNMEVIDYFYNLFSFNDFVQPVFGLFGREYPEHERIANIFVTINGKEPSHTELHHPTIAQWLPTIHEGLAAHNSSGFEQFDFKKPALIHFHDGQLPHYEIDRSRDDKRKRDEYIISSLNSLHFEMRKRVSSFRFKMFRTNDEMKK